MLLASPAPLLISPYKVNVTLGSPVKSVVRLVVAGAGKFGREHLKALANVSGTEVVGIADPNEGAARDAAAMFGHASAKIGTDAASLLDTLKPDGLIVATPGFTHVPLATAALERGIPVLLEKPVAPSLEQAASLRAAEKASSAFVLPGHVLRFSAPHRRFAQIVHSGAIGSVVSITARRHRDESHAVHYPDDPVVLTMIHDIDLALWISGGPARARVTATRTPQGTHRSETLATVTRDDGRIWRLSTAWSFPSSAACPPDRIEVICENGAAELEVGNAIRVYGNDVQTIDISDETDDGMLQAEDAYFADCIRAGEHPTRLTLADAISGLAIAEAAQASIRSSNIEDV